MQYFQSNFQTLTSIAKLCGFDGLAGYLILARHTTGRQILEFPPHLLSGAGVNSIHEKLGCSEQRAKAILQNLIEHEFVATAPTQAKMAAPRSARWILEKQYPLNISLPHDLVDAPEISRTSVVTSPLRRLKKLSPLEDQSKSEANCDGTMLLISMYAASNMQKFGGLPMTSTVYRGWKVISITPSENVGCFEWKAEPEQAQAHLSFMAESLAYSETDISLVKRFWNAFNNIIEAGLLYEVVTIFSEKNELLVSLRINDFHAGSIDREFSGDPSLLKELEKQYGSRLAFYSQSPNETMRATLPFGTGILYGIYRLRFRAGTEDTGTWFREETDRVQHAFDSVAESVTETYDDDF